MGQKAKPPRVRHEGRAKTKRDAAIRFLRNRGATVEIADMPGLYRINGDPEVTIDQVRDVAARLGWSRASPS